MRSTTTTLALAVLLLLCGCSQRSKHDILQETEQIETRAELSEALGAPDDRSKLGPIETWTYEASDGTVTFLITGDSVTLQTTGAKDED